MAKILFLETDKVAIKAFNGIINRSSHELVHVENVKDVWDALTKEKFFDLFILEINLPGDGGAPLIGKIKRDPFLSKLPIVIYSRITQKTIIHQMVHHDIQNYLIKPYEDEKLYIEIIKATKTKWWENYFDDQVPELLSRKDLKDNFTVMLRALEKLPKLASELKDSDMAMLRKMIKASDMVGFKELNLFIRDFIAEAMNKKMNSMQKFLDCVPNAIRLIQERLKPGRHTLAHNSKSPFHADNQASSVRSVERVAVWDDVRKKIDSLAGYPIIDSVAASFRMAAQFTDVEIAVLVSMIESDPSLTAQVFHYTNAESIVLKKKGARVEDPKHAIQILGLSKIRVFAEALITLPEDNFKFQGFDWKDYWMSQVGTAIIASEIVDMLSLRLDSGIVYSAGLMHNIGKVLLSYFYPEVYENAIEYAYNMNIFLSDTEKHYFGCDHETVGSYYARKSNFPKSIASCITHYCEPTKAQPEDQEMVAVVSLADYLCKTHDIGYSGSRIPRGINSIASHPSWSILKPLLYSGFSTVNFEQQIEKRMESLKLELIGKAEKEADKRDTSVKVKLRDKRRVEVPRVNMQ